MAETHENPKHIILILCILLISAQVANKIMKNEGSVGSSSSADEE